MGVHHDTIDRAARGGNPPPERRNAGQDRTLAGGNPPPGAGDGRRDARIIVQRDEREERREDKLKSIAAAARLSGLFSVLYSDIAWEDEFGPNPRQTELHYPVMKFEDVLAMSEEIKKITAEHAVHYMWALPT